MMEASAIAPSKRLYAMLSEPQPTSARSGEQEEGETEWLIGHALLERSHKTGGGQAALAGVMLQLPLSYR